MNLTTSVRTVLHKYFDFSGRASRSEFWWWILATTLLGQVLRFVDLAFLGYMLPDSGVLNGIFSLATIIPGIAVTVRRLHDSDWRGWWMLLPFATGLFSIPFFFTPPAIGTVLVACISLIGFALPLYLLIKKGTDDTNRFGQAPLAARNLQ